MKSRRLSNGKHPMEDDEDAANQLGRELKLADLIWVKNQGGSWWPAQVVDYNTVSRNNKPSKRSAEKVCVRLYGSYKYMYVDPLKCHSDFNIILKQNNGCYREIFLKALERDVSCSKSSRSKKQGSKSKESVAEDASRRMSSRKHPRKNPETDSSSLTADAQRTEFSVRVSPRRQFNAIAAQSKVHNNLLSTRVAESKRKSSRTDGSQQKQNGPSDEAEVLSKSIARRLRVMQQLGLIAPSGSAFRKNRLI